MNVAICKLRDNAQTPERGSEWAAGYDLHACLDGPWIEIKPGETKKVPTGIALSLPHDYFGAIFARSGLATKYGLRPANCVGVVDSDYRGEIMVALHNDSSCSCIINDGERIAQLVVVPFLPVKFKEVKSLDATERGAGGFGSTGSM